jgi:4-hydroxybenzoate polyprenyltransferase
VGTAFDARTGVVFIGGMFGVLGVYFLAQFFQGSEDAKRGYRTRVVTHGSEATLATARMALRVAWGLGLGLLLAGWLPRPLLCVYPVVWAHDRAMGTVGSMNGSEGAQRAQRLILQLGGLVAMCLLIATLVYVWDSFHGEDVAGQATSSRHCQ